ncbi:hypothetical protein [Mesorhizobium sp. J18]|uniref:hypothetical protein n=1 Tax=Mesorhizobium sp. J18 TaxID=935263 RepID=UPI0011A8DC27|nr:hypothetical protein [Mesorhizobium sp. J18]
MNFRLVLLWGAAAAALSACTDGGSEAPAPATRTPMEESSASPSNPSFYGSWAADPAWCSGEGEGTPITLSEGQFEGRENICDMQVAVEGEGAWTATLTCTGEGTTSSERIRLNLESENALALTYLDRDGAKVELTRCP